jgi:RimJ/RimL family protein N-acetyltransferase
MNSLPLFIGRTLRLTVLNAEKDAPVAALWTYNPEIAWRLRDGQTNQPMTVFEVRKIFEGWAKDAEENGRDFVFGIRPRVDDRLVGFMRMAHVQWVHGVGGLNLAIGDPEDWGAYAREALEMALNFAFDELNLFRITMRISDGDRGMRDLLVESNFTLEVRQRQGLFRDGQYVDRLSFGMLRPEWQAFRSLEVA